MKGKLHLIPSTLGDTDPQMVLPKSVFDAVKNIGHFAVENIRSARRFLSSAGLKGNISDLIFTELSEHTTASELESLMQPLLDGFDVGLISEAGLPAVADPGAMLVDAAQSRGIKVIPYAGPSSLMMALMASGMNGQSFTFMGYLPVKPEERKKVLKEIERESVKSERTHIFIETPYRNDQIFQAILEICGDGMKLCVATNITLEDEYIVTKRVGEWRKIGLKIGKRPTVFLLGV